MVFIKKELNVMNILISDSRIIITFLLPVVVQSVCAPSGIITFLVRGAPDKLRTRVSVSGV
jgi:hypothetical protein